MKALSSFIFIFLCLCCFSQTETQVFYGIDSIGEYYYYLFENDTVAVHQDSATYYFSTDTIEEKKEKFVDYFNLMPKEVRDYTPNDFFEAYNDNEINSVEIYIVDRFDIAVFSQSYIDSAKIVDNKRGKSSATLVRKMLLFSEGDTLDSRLLADTERNIRENTIYKDAVIKVSCTENLPGVDVKVYVHDNRHWKAIFWGSPTSLMLGGAAYDFLGVSQKIAAYGGGFIDPRNPYSINLEYDVNNIFKSQINSSLKLFKQNQTQSISAKISRDFFAYNTKWAGMLKFKKNARKIEDNGISNNYNNKFYNLDSWLARSFAVPKYADKFKNLRLILSARATVVKHNKIPENQPFQNFVNRQFYITSFGFANRDWYGFEELYRFRKFDYTPKGLNAALFLGYEVNQFLGGRVYNGFTINYNKVYEKFGFLKNQIKYGSFIRNKQFEQITVQNINTYFTNRIKLNKLGFRQFISTNLTLSYDRPFSEFYNIGNTAIKGFDSQKLIATKSLVLNFESVFYTPITWWSSRGNFFFFADIGWTGNSNSDFLFNNTLHQGYGCGIRFQHRILAIDFMEISFAYYPNGYLVDEKNWGYNIGDIPPKKIDTENLFEPETLKDIY